VNIFIIYNIYANASGVVVKSTTTTAGGKHGGQSQQWKLKRESGDVDGGER
jgi:hypothetical protein